MRSLSRLVALSTVLLSTVLVAPAGIDDSWDWKKDPDTSAARRKLRVWYNFDQAKDKLGDQLVKSIADEALKNWNDVKDKTGWEFVAGDKDNHDIEIKVGAAGGGGQTTSGFPPAADRNREVSNLTITVDPNPTGFKWDQAGLNKDDTKNPISSLKHELTHTMRLDHQGGLRSTSLKIKDPQGTKTKDDDVLTPSADDIAEARKAAGLPIKVASTATTAGANVTAAISGFPTDIPIFSTPPESVFSIPGSAILSAGTIVLSRTSLYSMPDPFTIFDPGGAERMVKGVHVDLTGVSLLSQYIATIDIPYENGSLGLIDIADPEFTNVVERTLRPYVYDPSGPIRQWVALTNPSYGGSFTLDMSTRTLSANVPVDLLSRYVNADDHNTSTLFLSIAGDDVPEPGSAGLVAIGIALLGFARLRRAQRPGTSLPFMRTVTSKRRK